MLEDCQWLEIKCGMPYNYPKVRGHTGDAEYISGIGFLLRFMDDKRPVGKALSADLHMALSELWQGEARSSWAREGKKVALDQQIQ